MTRPVAHLAHFDLNLLVRERSVTRSPGGADISATSCWFGSTASTC
jgi:hypothetical protein